MIIGETEEEMQDRYELWDFLGKLGERHGEYFDPFSQIPRESLSRMPKCMQPKYIPPAPNEMIDEPDKYPEIEPFKHRAIGWITEEDLEELNK